MPISAPRYAILRGQTECYACHAQTPVVALALPPEATVDDPDYPVGAGEHGWLNVVELEEIPAEVARQLQVFTAGDYRVDFSFTAGSEYVLNHCAKCGAKQGDHFMHSEPDGPFFGEDTGGLEARLIPEAISVESGHSEGPLGDWLLARYG